MTVPQHAPRPTSRRSLHRLALIAPAVVGALALAACSSNTASTTASSSTGSGGGASGKGVNVVVIGGASDDPFFSSVKRGVDDATKAVQAAGGKVTYLTLANYNNLGPDAAKLVDTALSQNADVIAVPDWVPDAEDPSIKKAIAAKVPVVVYNAGDLAKAKELGALTYVGTDEELAGERAGQEAADGGAKHTLCVNTVPGAANLEARCAGIKKSMQAAGQKSTELPLPASSFGNQTAVTQAIKSALSSDPSVDCVLTVGTTDVESAAAAISQAGTGDKVKLIGFNLSSNQLDRIQKGTQQAAIDQQPYPQGYYAVSAAFQFAQYGVELPTKPILTGPLVVNKSNVAAAVAGAKAGVR